MTDPEPGKEGPPTPRDHKWALKQIQWCDNMLSYSNLNVGEFDEVRGHLRAAREALELDEKRVALDSRRRAALEGLADCVRDFAPPCDLDEFNTGKCGVDKRLMPICPSCKAKEIVARLDTLTPTKEE